MPLIIAELEGFVEIFPVRLQQLSSISIVESSKILSAFKMFFNVLHASIASQARYVKYLARDLEGNFITLIQDECEKLSVNVCFVLCVVGIEKDL